MIMDQVKTVDHLSIWSLDAIQDHATLWTQVDRRKYNQGDKVQAYVPRTSQTPSTLGKCINKYHGYVLVEAVVNVLTSGERALCLEQAEAERITNPVATEQYAQGYNMKLAYLYDGEQHG